MPQGSGEQTLGFVIHDVARLLRRHFEQRAKAQDLGLTRAQCAVLARLSRQQGSSQVALAQILDIEPITLVPILDRLEAAGLISRKPDPRDRRANILELTEAARPALARILRVAQDVFAEAQAGIAPAEAQRLLELLDQIKDNLSNQTEDVSVRPAAVGRR